MKPALRRGARGADVELLQRALNANGAKLAVDGQFGPATEVAVARFQRDHGLASDGIAGDKTWLALGGVQPGTSGFEAELARARKRGAEADHVVDAQLGGLEEAGRRAIAKALEIWASDIIDPPVGMKGERAERSLRFINELLRATGWDWVGRYDGNGHPPEWCALFAAYCWLAAGLEGEWPEHFWASNYRLAQWVRYRPFNGVGAGARPATGGRMFIDAGKIARVADLKFPDGTAPRAGDIVIVGDGEPDEGDHVTMLIAIDDKTGAVSTVSGNGGGLGPDGKRREGVVKTDYYLDRGSYRVVWVYRPGVDDVVATSSASSPPRAEAR